MLGAAIRFAVVFDSTISSVRTSELTGTITAYRHVIRSLSA
jgi:hypothetical protein